MQLGIHLPQIGAHAGPTALRDITALSQDVGLDSVWVSDHLAFPVEPATPYPYSPDGSFPVEFDTPWLEALSTMSYVAALTDRLTIGVSVLVLPMRATIPVARQLATLAALAPGRIVVGIGVGWMREEYEALGADFSSRGAILDEQLAALRRLWTDEGPSADGAHVRFPPVVVEPRPTPPPRLWIGGTADAALDRAGRLGDGWHAVSTIDADAIAPKLAQARQAAADAGRDPASIELTVRIGTRPGQRGIASLRRRLEPFAAAGCTHAVVDPVVASVEELADVARDLGALRAELA